MPIDFGYQIQISDAANFVYTYTLSSTVLQSSSLFIENRIQILEVSEFVEFCMWFVNWGTYTNIGLEQWIQ